MALHTRTAQVFVGSAAQGGQGVDALKAWAISKLPLGPTLYSKVGWLAGWLVLSWM
jgi:hypothetical protein